MARCPGHDRMRRSYRIGGRVVRDRLRHQRPDDERHLATIRPAEVVAVRGGYDKLDLVLGATGVPFLHVDPDQVGQLDWTVLQVLFVNCPGQLRDDALQRLGPWVRRGGYLVTTDWAVKHVIEPLFPGTIRHSGDRTPECVVRAEMRAPRTDPLLAGFLEQGREPLWWLEGASFPVEVLDERRVRVIARSPELDGDHGALVVTFDEGQGTVLHLVSHLYLQRSDVREAADATGAAEYLEQAVGMSPASARSAVDGANDLRASELRSAISSAQLMSNAIVSGRRKWRERGSRRDAELANDEDPGGRPA